MNLDRINHNFRFKAPRIQYDKVFKPEYLPARVRYNQFFALALVGGLMTFNR